jgi:hypothetical protein
MVALVIEQLGPDFAHLYFPSVQDRNVADSIRFLDGEI